MKLKPYTKVALIYDCLMDTIDYGSWTNYIIGLADTYINKGGEVLELASGTCKIANYFSKKYKNFTATDISLQMLQYNQIKDLKMVCCDMSLLPFKSKFNFVFSTYDSINYLLKQNQLSGLFNGVYNLLDTDGVFTFDVSLENNSSNFIKSKTISGKFRGYEYEIVSNYKKNSRIHSNYIYISDKYGKKFKEVHKQKIYDINTFFKLSEKTGFHTEACFDCFSHDDINVKSKRAQFVLRKK